MNKLPVEIIEMTIKLADLEFIKYVKICDETLSASSDNYSKRPKVPITNKNHETAIGVKILYSVSHKTISFFDINLPVRGNGSKMVYALLKGFPTDWNPAVVMDWSYGFWNKMKERYNKLKWIM